jgi:hypothetical protein
MSVQRPAFDAPNRELRKAGVVVGITDRVYPITGDTITFADILVRGDLSGMLEYNGRKLEITAVDTIIGLEIGAAGPRGPVWKGVVARVTP